MLILALLIACFWSTPAVAHKPSDSYLRLSVRDQVVSGQWDIALRDLDYAIGLDADGDGAITWGELKARHDAIATYALGHLRVSSGGQPCALQAEEQLVDRHTDGTYTVLRFSARCAARARRLVLHYDLFFELDAQHRGLWRAEHEGQTQIGIFTTDHREHTLALDAPSRLAEFLDYGREGVWHIWLGYDHILFLLSLLLPAVLWRSGRHWVPVPGFRPALTEVVKVVTAFTLAHSVTLSLAVLKVIVLPARLVESAIAASVLLAALNNLYPLVTSRRWLVAFGFGLVHGLGFASVLLDLGLPTGSLILALVAFNLGVEGGQLAIVTAFLPLAYGASRTTLYTRMVFQGGSLGIMLMAALWLVQRSLDLKLL
jgi:HupE / UreJ protein